MICSKPSFVLLLSLLFSLLYSSARGQKAFDCNSSYYPDATPASAVLINRGVAKEEGCPVVATPCIYDGCEAGIERYLARAVKMTGLVRFNTRGTCWGLPNPPHFSTPGVNCEPPYDLCYGYYCPDKYAEAIEMLVDLNAQLVLRAATAWYIEEQFAPQDNHTDSTNGLGLWGRSKQLIVDINAAYDCAGLRRPIVQAGIFESVGEGVNRLYISAEVIEFFREEIEQLPAHRRSRYLNSDGSPKQNVKYDRMLMLQDTVPPVKPQMDIKRIEAKLWVFFQAKTFIDFGYKGLHFGQYYFMTREEAPSRYEPLHHLLSAIRGYAEEKGSFVLIAGENLNLPVAKVGDQLLFDYEMRAMRPREISSPPVLGDVEGCDILPDPDLFAGTPCQDVRYPAYIDPCVVHGGVNGGTIIGTGGVHPLGCNIAQQPYLIYFDFGPGAAYYEEGGMAYGKTCQVPAYDFIGKAKVKYPPDFYTYLVWGYDDQRWFGYELDRACRSFWLEDHQCNWRLRHSPHGFIQIPGLTVVNRPENYCNVHHNNVLIDSSGQWYNTHYNRFDTIRPAAMGFFFMGDDPALLSNVSHYMQAATSSIVINAGCRRNLLQLACSPQNQLMDDARAEAFVVQLGTDIKDCSSIYVWEVESANSGWSAKFYGANACFEPPESGAYRIRLTQHNLGLSVNEYENSLLLQDTIAVFDKEKCPDVRNALALHPNPTSGQVYLSYDFQSGQTYTIRVFDITGQLVYTKDYSRGADWTFVELRLPVSLPQGMYTAVLQEQSVFIGHGRFALVR